MSLVKSLTVTTEGTSAAIAQDNLSLQLAITHIALHDGTSEIKRMAVSAGDEVADDMIHATILDMTEDAYSVKRIELYANTVLFAYYEQSSVIIEKTSATGVIVPADFKLTTVPPGSVTVTGNQFSYPPASEEVKGVAKIATQLLVDSGEDHETFVTPKTLAERLKASDFPEGTRMAFFQPSAPLGWTKITTHNDAAIRIVNGSTGGSAGGSVSFSQVMKSHTVTGTVANHTLSQSRTPVHRHRDQEWRSTNFDTTGGTHPVMADASGTTGSTRYIGDSIGGGGEHAHGFTGGEINLSVKYVDTIICERDED